MLAISCLAKPLFTMLCVGFEPTPLVEHTRHALLYTDPAEAQLDSLIGFIFAHLQIVIGGSVRDRTEDYPVMSQRLYQLSYGTIM